MKRLVFIIQLAVFVVCSAGVLTGSSRRFVDISERASGAHKVVVATATRVTPTWRRNASGDQLIVSQVALQVEEVLKGTPSAALSMDLEGGTIGSITLKVSDVPDLKPGERAVFFLDSAAGGSHVPHLKGLGILKLDANNQVPGSSLRLDDIRTMTQSAGR